MEIKYPVVFCVSVLQMFQPNNIVISVSLFEILIKCWLTSSIEIPLLISCAPNIIEPKILRLLKLRSRVLQLLSLFHYRSIFLLTLYKILRRYNECQQHSFSLLFYCSFCSVSSLSFYFPVSIETIVAEVYSQR